MFGLSLPELFVISLIALLLIKPEDAPEVMRAIGKFIGRIKRMTKEVTDSFNEVINDEDVKEITGITGEKFKAFDTSDLASIDSSRKKESKED